MSDGPAGQELPTPPSPPAPTGPPEPDPNHPASYPPPPNEPTAPGRIPDPTTDGGTSQALSQLLFATPFSDLHNRAAGDHWLRRNICFALDLVTTAVVYFVLLAVIITVAAKVLAPLPPIFEEMLRGNWPF